MCSVLWERTHGGNTSLGAGVICSVAVGELWIATGVRLSLGVVVGSTSGVMTGLWGILVRQYTCLCCLFVCWIVCGYHFLMIVTIVMFLFVGVQILQYSAVILLMVLILVDRFGEVSGAGLLTW